MCMCLYIKTDNGEEYVTNQGELAEVIGAENIVISEGYPEKEYTPADADVCLCPVDMIATASKAGFFYRREYIDADGEPSAFDGEFYRATGVKQEDQIE